MSKIMRLLRALSNETIRRLPYIIFILAILFVVQYARLSAQTAHGVQIASDNSVVIKQLLNQVAQLSEENKQLIIQNKQLSEQNKQLATEGVQHMDCLADLFAKYTRDYKPIYKVDLSTCMIIPVLGGTSSTVGRGDVRPSLTGQSGSASSSSNNNTNNGNGQQNNSQNSVLPFIGKPLLGCRLGICI